MAGLTVQELLFKARAEVGDAVKSLTDMHTKMGEGTKSAAATGLGGLLGFVGGAVTVGAASRVFDFVKDSLGGMAEKALATNKGMAQTAAVLKSTHGVSGQTAESVDLLSRKLGLLSGVDDDVVRSAANMLLTFTNIKGGVFPQATQATMDMAAALGEDATSAAMQLGKALNDPIGGVTALRRVGVQLTDSQQQLIDKYVKHGQMAQAQAVILKELQTEFGGSAKAAGDSAGPIQKLSLLWDEMQKTIGNAVLPILQRAADAVMPLVLSFGEKLPGALQRLSQMFSPVIDAIGRFFAPITTNKETLNFLSQNFETIAIIAGGVLAGALVAAGVAAWGLAAGVIAATWPFLAIGAAIAGVVVLFKYAYEHWTGFRLVVDATKDAIMRFAAGIGPAFSAFGSWIQSVIKWFQELGAKIALGTQAGVLAVQMMVTGIGNWFSNLGKSVHDFFASIGAFFVNAWNGIVGTVEKAIHNIVSWFEFAYAHSYVFQAIVDAIVATFNWARNFITTTWSAITSFLVGAWNFYVNLSHEVWSRIGSAIQTVNNTISGVVRAVWGAITGFLAGQWAVIVGAAQAAWNGFVGVIQGAIGRAASAAGAVNSAIVGVLKGIIGTVTGIGKNIIEGLIAGIRGMIGAVGSAIGAVVGKIKDGLVGALGIHSPSTLTAYMGAMLGQGLIEGFAGQDVAGRISDQMRLIGSVAGAGISVGVSGGVSGATGGAPVVSTQSSGSGRPAVMVVHVHSHNYLDGREVSESVLKHSPAIASLATGRRDW